MLIRNGKPKELKLDQKAARQIFDKEHGRDDKGKFAFVPKDTENPIDIKLRQLSLVTLDSNINFKKEFFDKWVVILSGNINGLKYIIGRIKDIFFDTRDVYVKTRGGEVFIVPFGRILELKDSEPA